jgi:hypothetical protein
MYDVLGIRKAPARSEGRIYERHDLLNRRDQKKPRYIEDSEATRATSSIQEGC